MKVLHLVKTAVGATWALRQMRELVRLGVEVHVAVPPGPLVQQYETAGVQIHLAQLDFPMRRPNEILGRLHQMRELVEQVRPDIIHSHFVGTTLTMRLALGKSHPTPRVFQVPGPLHLEHALFRAAEIGLAGKSDYWIGSCKWTCERYAQSGISESRIFLSYYGTDVDTFSQPQKGKLRTMLEVSSDTKIVGMVAFMYAPKYYLGQTRGLKGHEDLIDALALCQQKRDDVIGVFIGGAWNQAARYERQVREYGRQKCGDRAIFLGSRNDVSELYPDFDVTVHPSHSENVGGAVESLLMSIPTITTRVGGFPDVVISGETGWLVPPRKPAVLAETIGDVLGNPSAACQFAANGQKIVTDLFDVRHTAAQVFGVYHQIIH